MIRYVIGLAFYRVGSSTEAERAAGDREAIVEHGDRFFRGFARNYSVDPGAILAVDHAIEKLRETEAVPVSIDYTATQIVRKAAAS